MSEEKKISIGFIILAIALTALNPQALSSSVALFVAVGMFCLIKYFDKQKDDRLSKMEETVKDLNEQIKSIKLHQMVSKR